MEHAFVGVHVTSIENANSILVNGFSILEKRERYAWLGKGIYFWDNDLGLCHWMAKHRRYANYAIIKAQIRVPEERFLDLAPRETREQFHSYIHKFPARPNELLPRFPESLGTIVDMTCKRLGEPYSVVRGIFEGVEGIPLFTKPQPTINVKMVIAVRDLTCISSLELVYRDSNVDNA